MLTDGDLIALLTQPASARPRRLSDLVGSRPLVLYGCGDGLITFNAFVASKYGLKPQVMLDAKFTHATSMGDIPAMSPLNYEPTDHCLQEGVVIITAGKPQFRDAMIASARELGFTRIILASDIYEYHLSYAPRGFEEVGQAFYRSAQDQILRAWRHLSDERSREVFLAVLGTHVYQSPQPVPCEDPDRQYLSFDGELTKGASRLINCGAYDGDTLQRIASQFGKLDAAACFEPDKENFSKLTEMLSTSSEPIARLAIAFPCGVWDGEEILRFSAGRRINSAIDEVGERVIQCVSIDNALPNFSPTFINMDVEGAELHALRGAERTLRNCRPDLAICVYHHPAHLWQALLWLLDLDLGYRFSLRNYSGMPAETVLYATSSL